MGEASNKHVISTTQGDGMIAYFQPSKIYIQEAISQHNGISDW